jgi:hypothetical protein
MMQTVRLSSIVMKYTPEMIAHLKPKELNSEIVLVNGIEALDEIEAMEIIQYSISEHQKDAYIH